MSSVTSSNICDETQSSFCSSFASLGEGVKTVERELTFVTTRKPHLRKRLTKSLSFSEAEDDGSVGRSILVDSKTLKSRFDPWLDDCIREGEWIFVVER